MVVRVGAASRRFLIVDRIDTNPLFNTYEAYVIHDKFVSKAPLVLMAFVNDNGDADRLLRKELNYRLGMKEKNVVVDRARFILVYGGDNESFQHVFQGDRSINISEAMLRNEIGHLDDSETEKTALENLVTDMMRITVFGNPNGQKLDDEAKSTLFNGFVEKLEKKKYEECREMIKMLDAETVEKWTELFDKNQQIFWQ
jgi:hypothetical protein